MPPKDWQIRYVRLKWPVGRSVGRPGAREAASCRRGPVHLIDLMPAFLELAQAMSRDFQKGRPVMPPERVDLLPASESRSPRERAVCRGLRETRPPGRGGKQSQRSRASGALHRGGPDDDQRLDRVDIQRPCGGCMPRMRRGWSRPARRRGGSRSPGVGGDRSTGGRPAPASWAARAAASLVVRLPTEVGRLERAGFMACGGELPDFML